MESVAKQSPATLTQRAAVALGDTANETKLRALAAQSAGIVSVTNKDGREEAHRAGMVLANTRVSITKTGKAAREDATAFSKAVIAMEKDLIAIIEPEELRVMALRDGYDAIEAKRVADAIAAERARTDLIKEHIEDIRRIPLRVAGATSAAIQIELDDLRDLIITEERFGEQVYREQARDVRCTAFNLLETMLTEALAKEAEAARLVAEREADDRRRAAEAEELDRQRVEQQRVAAELAAAQKALDDAAAAQRDALRIEAERAAAIRKAEDEERARVAAEVKAQLDAQQAEIAAGQRRLAEQQAAADARDAAARQAEEAAANPAPALQLELAPVAAPLQPGSLDANFYEVIVPADEPPVAAVALPAPTLRLGQIGERLGFVVTAAFVGSLGFEPAGRDKNAVLFHEHDFKNICAALLRHIAAVSAAN